MGTDWPLLFSRTTVIYISTLYPLGTPIMRTSGDVKAVLETVDGGDLALTALVCSTGNHDLVLDIVQ
jgi:hypothetical protein